MPSPRAEELITEVVNELTDQNRMFTALDISREVQSRLKNENEPFERHRELKETVHLAVELVLSSGDYDRSLQDVGAPSAAFVYYAVGYDPSSYAPIPRDNKGTQDAPTVSIPVANRVADSDDDDDDDDGDAQDNGRKPDQRGSVSIPNFLVAAAGLDIGDKVFVTPITENGETTIHLSKDEVDGEQPLQTKYTVNCNRNVRITQGVLAASGFDTDATYDFEQRNDRVVVSAH